MIFDSKWLVVPAVGASALMWLSCSSNIKRIGEIHVPDGSRDTTDQVIESRKQLSLDFKVSGVRFDTRFKSGAAAEIAERSKDHFDVLIRPENSPINDSAWFAFRISSLVPTQARDISVRLVYNSGTHRYHPKISLDGHDWKSLEDARYQVSSDKKDATLSLPVTDRPLWVAAQEIIDSDSIRGWMSRQVKHPFVKSKVIGQSTSNRDIAMLTIAEPQPGTRKHLVILGRQHPPETTGTMALMTFVETICDESELSKRFRHEFETRVIPMINPDGVDDGHWRHNHKGIDLNRDWAFFRQKETKVVSQELEKLKGQDLVFAIDFHSTFNDIFYVLQDNVQVARKGLTEKWIQDIATAIPDYRYRVQAVTNDVPAATIWINKVFVANTVAYEVGDETERNKLREISKVAAQSLMKRLLEE